MCKRVCRHLKHTGTRPTEAAPARITAEDYQAHLKSKRLKLKSFNSIQNLNKMLVQKMRFSGRYRRLHESAGAFFVI